MIVGISCKDILQIKWFSTLGWSQTSFAARRCNHFRRNNRKTSLYLQFMMNRLLSFLYMNQSFRILLKQYQSKDFRIHSPDSVAS